MSLILSFFFLAVTGAYPQTNISHDDDTLFITIPAERVVDKIRGGMLGQMLGNLNGIPHEFKYIEQPGNVTGYTPSLPEGAWTDDDTDFEWVYIVHMQKERNAFLPDSTIYALWKSSINKNIWCANRYSRYLMDLGIKPPYTGYIAFSPWAEFNISGQFLSETYGLLAPAMPQTAARIGLHYTTVAIDNEPAQTTQLITTMISMAFIENDIDAIIDAGMSAMDPGSRVLQVCRDVRQWYRENPDDWQRTRQRLQEKYAVNNNNMRDRNGYELNTGSIIAALLYGKGDFAETLRTAFNFGWDADCTAATCGTIVGVMQGYRRMMSEGWQIVDRYRNTTRDNMPMDETITSFCDRLVDLFEVVNEENGGRKTVINNIPVYRIPSERPGCVLKLASLDEQIRNLKQELGQTISGNLLYGDRQGKARAAYMAICLDMNSSLSRQYPEKWDEACYDLKGYWKIMQNLFNDGNNFRGLMAMRKKFIAAGFEAPMVKYSDQELYTDTEAWKDPGK